MMLNLIEIQSKICDTTLELDKFNNLMNKLTVMNEIGIHTETGCTVHCKRFIYRQVSKNMMSFDTLPGKE